MPAHEVNRRKLRTGFPAAARFWCHLQERLTLLCQLAHFPAKTASNAASLPSTSLSRGRNKKKGQRYQRDSSHAQARRESHHRGRHSAGVRRRGRLHPGRYAVLGEDDSDVPRVPLVRFGVYPHQGAIRAAESVRIL